MKKDAAPPTVLSVTVLAVSLFGDALVISNVKEVDT